MSNSQARSTKGFCPYCGESSLQHAQESRVREDQELMICCNSACLRYCTKTKGQFYPHDDSRDPFSDIAKVVFFDVNS